MKRSTKVFISSLISFSMIVLNLPMTALSIRADGDDSAPKAYTLSWNKDTDETVLKEGDTVISNGTYLYPGTITLTTEGGDDNTIFRYKIDENDPQDVNSTEYTFTHYSQFMLIRFDHKDPNNPNSSDSIDIELRTAYHVSVSSNIWCDYEITMGDRHDRHTDIRDHLKVSQYDANDYGEPEEWDYTDTITAFEAELYHTPDDIGNDNPEYDFFRFTNFEINGENMTHLFRYATNHFDASELSNGSFDPGDGFIEIKISGDATHGSTIEWADSSVDDPYIQANLVTEHCVFDHGSAEILAVLDNTGRDISEYYDLEHCKDEYGNGGIIVESGYQIVFRLTPEYGYQLYSVNENGFPDRVPTYSMDETQACIYHFQVHDNCVHFSSTFVREPDVLDAARTAEVPEGRVDLSNANLPGGTGLVTVSDIDGAAYANTEWDNDLEAQEYFNIDLANRYRTANGDQYWENEVHNLEDNGTATIALELGEDFEPENENVQVIHIPEGGQPEYLDTTYDAETHTVYFTTTGFSDYVVGSTDNSVPELDEQTINDVNNQNIDGPNDPQQGNQPQGHTEYVIAAEGSGFALRRNYDPDNTQNPTEFDLRDGDQIEDDAEIRFDSSVNRTSFEIVVDGDTRFLFPDNGDSFCPNEWLVFEGINISGDEPYAINFSRRDEPGEEPPHFFVGQSGNEYGLGGEYIGEGDQLIFEPFNIGENIPDDATINLSNEFRGTDTVVMISVDGNIVYVLSADEIDRGFVPGHWLRYDGVTEDNNGITVNFTTIWVIQIAGQTGFELTVVDEDGDPMLPNYAPDDFEYPFVTDFGFDEYGEPYTLTFEEMPYMAIVRPHNAVFTMLLDEDYEFIPYGDNEILYPADDDCGFAFIWHEGMPYIDADCIEDLAFDIDGLGEDDESMYAVTIREFDVTDLSEEEFAQFSDMAATGDYTDSMPLLGLEINLFKDGEEYPIHDPGFTILIKLQLCEPLELEDGEAIFIIHMLPDNEFEIIEATYDADEMTLTFEASTFSPFVVCRGSKDETTTNNTTTNTNTNTTTTTNTPTPVAAPTATTPAETSATENKSDAKTEETSNPTPTPTTAPSSGTASTGEKAVSVSATIGLILILSAAAVAVYRKRSSAIGNDED